MSFFFHKMSKEYNRLPDSKRNEIIANFQEGKIDPEYEVIPNKNTKGKYTVRRRKVNLPTDTDIQDANNDAEPTEEVQPEANIPEKVMMNDNNYIPFNINNQQLFTAMQMQLNQMIIEQMKVMRQQTKINRRKNEKLKTKSQKIYDILSEVANTPLEEEKKGEVVEGHEEEDVNDGQQNPEPEPAPSPEPVNEDFYSPNYQNTQPVKEIVPEKIAPRVEPPQYKQDYEQQIDEIGGFIFRPYSRRDKFNMKNFNI